MPIFVRRLRRASRLTGVAALMLGASACTPSLVPRLSSCPQALAPVPPIVHAADTGWASTTLDVLSFNIEGLGWPARSHRAPELRRIGQILAELNARGDAPDIILVQEAFSPAAVKAMMRSGYRYYVWGPARTQRKALPAEETMPGPFRWKKGETGFHLVGSGLVILSRYPIVASRSEPFGKHRCAGFDCLSNKGIQYAAVAMPGVPQPIGIFNTHLNSQGASRVPPGRSNPAHAMQVGDVARVIGTATGPDAPVILGGDFNMRGAPDRMAVFDRRLDGLEMVHRFCASPANGCDVRISWDGDAPWMDTEDLQFFRDGQRVAIRPVAVEAMFDGSHGNPQLSDHDGFRVRYALSWATRPAAATPAAKTAAACRPPAPERQAPKM